MFYSVSGVFTKEHGKYEFRAMDQWLDDKFPLVLSHPCGIWPGISEVSLRMGGLTGKGTTAASFAFQAGVRQARHGARGEPRGDPPSFPSRRGAQPLFDVSSRAMSWEFSGVKWIETVQHGPTMESDGICSQCLRVGK